jgi:hypothetical protein
MSPLRKHGKVIAKTFTSASLSAMETEEDCTFLQQIDSAPVVACTSVWRISLATTTLEDKMSVRGCIHLRSRMLASDVPGRKYRVLSTCHMAKEV